MALWVGIDIGSASVKVAILRGNVRRLELVGAGSADIAIDGEGRQAAAVSQALLAALQGKALGGSDAVAVAVDGSKSTVKRLTLPPSAQRQLEQILPFELDSVVPFDMSEAVFDYLTTTSSASPEQLSVLVAVARVSDVRNAIELVKDVTRAEAERVCVGAFALASLTLLSPTDVSTTAVLDIGARSTDLLVIHQGEPVFARTISVGTSGLPAQAERLARELRLSFGTHRAQGGTPIERCILVGGGAYVPGAVSFISRELQVPADTLTQVACEITLAGPEFPPELPRFAKAIGIALSLSGKVPSFNLRRGQLAYERGFGWLREKVPVLSGLGAALFVSFSLASCVSLRMLGKRGEALREHLGATTEQVLGERTDDPTRVEELLEDQAGTSDEDPYPHADAFDVMVKLSDSVPEDIKHDIEELDVRAGRVLIRGIVDTPTQVDKVKDALSAQRCLADVKQKGITQQPGTSRQKYELEAELRCPEDVKTKGGAAAPSASVGGK